MKKRQIIGWLFVLTGTLLFIIGINSIHKPLNNQEMTSKIKVFFTHNPLWNPIIKFFGGKAQKKLPAHNEQAMITQNLGIIFVVVGGSIVYLSRKRTRTSHEKIHLRKRMR